MAKPVIGASDKHLRAICDEIGARLRPWLDETAQEPSAGLAAAGANRSTFNRVISRRCRREPPSRIARGQDRALVLCRNWCGFFVRDVAEALTYAGPPARRSCANP